MSVTIGPTGKFPQGKINENDQGELAFAVTHDREKNLVIINFCKDVSWLGLDPNTCEGFIQILQKHLKELKPGVKH